MRWNVAGMLALLLCGALSLGALAVAETGELTTWDMPFASAFPSGIALGDDGTVFIAASGTMDLLRLDPINNLFRSWGVSEHPQDVIVVDGIAFCTVKEANHISFLNPESLGTHTAMLPFPNLGLDEIHRGPDTADGNVIFWIAESSVHGVLRFEYDSSNRPEAFGTQYDAQADSTVQFIDPQVVAATREQFAYDVTAIPDAYLLPVTQASPPFTEWRLPLNDELWVTDLAVADDGTLWISAGLPSLFRFDPFTGMLQEMETIQNVAIFQGLLPAADGSIWFGNIVEGSIGHFNPITGLSEVWRIPGTGEVYDLVFDDQGMIWYTDRVGGAIGRLNTSTNETTVYPLPEGSEPLYLKIDAAGDIWFSAGVANYVGKLDLLP